MREIDFNRHRHQNLLFCPAQDDGSVAADFASIPQMCIIEFFAKLCIILCKII